MRVVYFLIPLLLYYLYIYISKKHSLTWTTAFFFTSFFFSNFLSPSFLSPPRSLEKDSKFVKEGSKVCVQIKALSFMGFSRLVFLSFLVFLSCMQKREGKKTTIYNFCYTHDFFRFLHIHIFFPDKCLIKKQFRFKSHIKYCQLRPVWIYISTSLLQIVIQFWFFWSTNAATIAGWSSLLIYYY